MTKPALPALEFVQPPQQPFANFFLYGPPKTGKTLAAGSGRGNVLYVNADLPNATYMLHRRAKPDGRIHELKYKGYSTLAAIEQIVWNQDQAKRMFDWLVIDPIGELHRRLLAEGSNNAIRPSLPLYGDVGAYVERFCRSYCEAPINVVLVAHEWLNKDEEANSWLRLPWTGTTNTKLGNTLMGMVDVVGYTAILPPEQEGQPPTYAAQLLSMSGRRGGDRYDALGAWQPLDLARWCDLIGAHTGTPLQQAAEDNQQPLAAA